MSNAHPGATRHKITLSEGDQQEFKLGEVIQVSPAVAGFRILHQKTSGTESVLSDGAELTSDPVRRLVDTNRGVVITFLPKDPLFRRSILVGQVRVEEGEPGKGGTAVFVAEDDGGKPDEDEGHV